MFFLFFLYLFKSILFIYQTSLNSQWEPENLTTQTKFLMGAKANKALGYGATRGRMYIKHPDIFKVKHKRHSKVLFPVEEFL